MKRYTGHEREEELDGGGASYYAGARYYDAMLGRWMAVDPLAEKHPEWTPYNYVLNNPMFLVDPDGRQEAYYNRARELQALSGPEGRAAVSQAYRELNPGPALSASAEALYDPRNMVTNLNEFKEGKDKYSGLYASERIVGLQQMTDAAGGTLGMIENYAGLLVLTAATGNIEIAGPALGVRATAGAMATAADFSSLSIEVAQIVFDPKNGSGTEAMRRFVTMVINIAPFHIRQEQLEAIIKQYLKDTAKETIEEEETPDSEEEH